MNQFLLGLFGCGGLTLIGIQRYGENIRLTNKN